MPDGLARSYPRHVDRCLVSDDYLEKQSRLGTLRTVASAERSAMPQGMA